MPSSDLLWHRHVGTHTYHIHTQIKIVKLNLEKANETRVADLALLVEYLPILHETMTSVPSIS